MSFIINPYVFGAAGGSAPPSGLASIWMWGEPSRETGLVNNDPMGTLTDQSGNGRHFTQATGSLKPLYKTSILNSLACARGEGNSGGVPLHWSGPSMAALTAGHVFAVAICDTEGVGNIDNGLWAFGTAGGDHYPWGDNQIYDGCLATVRKTVGVHTGQPLTSWRVAEVVSTSSEWTYKLDGTQLFTTATNTVVGRATPLFMRNAGSGGDSLKGYIAGLYICSAKLSGGDRTTLITYINSRFGLSAS